MEDVNFVAEDVRNATQETISHVIGNQPYQHGRVTQLTENVIEEVLKKLTAIKKPYKYLVSCIITQKNGAGLHSACSCYWDSNTDGVVAVRWENRSMHCVVTVFGVAI
ncbi:dynein light chain tctex-type 1 protein [Kipferlia bialata]|uniref:Dynein light chain tctex-type 1 protein n=1 Tax=Kipferlia bialata TaxID=797122 RepID=A0A391P782_9EUKA|nr:dynein light chain tctex-type 1 protein [Kipferlia bialata]|eukprot:g12134.t1